MITLDARLQACADFVTGRGMACDVGTDHAYLPAYLILSRKCAKALACDVRDGPLNAARQTLVRWNVSQAVELVKSDGLKSVPMQGVTDLILAGMGGELICAILQGAAAPLRDLNLILQPMTQAPMLRKWLYANGFALCAERPVRQERFLYTVMQAAYTGECREISPRMQQTGVMDVSEPLAREYVRMQAHRLEKAGLGIQKGNKGGFNEPLELAYEIYDWLENTD